MPLKKLYKKASRQVNRVRATRFGKTKFAKKICLEDRRIGKPDRRKGDTLVADTSRVTALGIVFGSGVTKGCRVVADPGKLVDLVSNEVKKKIDARGDKGRKFTGKRLIEIKASDPTVVGGLGVNFGVHSTYNLRADRRGYKPRKKNK